jgi:hypothetical protein
LEGNLGIFYTRRRGQKERLVTFDDPVFTIRKRFLDRKDLLDKGLNEEGKLPKGVFISGVS